MSAFGQKYQNSQPYVSAFEEQINHHHQTSESTKISPVKRISGPNHHDILGEEKLRNMKRHLLEVSHTYKH